MSRGNSLIAGVVLVGLLGTLAVGLQASTPPTEITTQTAAVLLADASKTKTETKTAEPAKMGCFEDFKYAAITGKDGQIKTGCQQVSNTCKGQFASEGVGSEKAYKDSDALPTCIAAVKESTTKNKDKTACKLMPADTCNLTHCFEDKNNPGKLMGCREIKNGTFAADQGFAPKNNEDFGLKQTVKDAASGNTEAQQLLSKLSQDKGFQSGLDSAFKDQMAEQQTKIDQAAYQKDNACDGISAGPECEAAKKGAQERLEQEQKKLATMQAQKELLAAQQAKLDPKTEKEKTETKEKTEKGCAPNCGPNGPSGPGGPGGNTFPGGGQNQQCSGFMQILGACQQNQQGQQNQQQCVRSYNPLYVENRPATPGCLNYQQQQCGLIQAAIGTCQNQNNQNPYQQCTPQHFCTNGALYWGTPQNQNFQNYQNYQPYGYGYGYGQNCTNQLVQQCPQGCAPVSANGVSTQCAGQGTAPTATISCGDSSKKYDVGMNVPITYSCTNATSVSGSGFSISNSGQLSGSVSAIVQKPPAGSTIVSYGLTCNASSGQTGTARCDVNINVPSIVMVANPKEVVSGEKTTIGWTTKGMSACTIWSPEHEEFNEENEENTSTSGTAQTPTLIEETEFFLTCITNAEQTKEAKVTVKIKGAATSTSSN